MIRRALLPLLLLVIWPAQVDADSEPCSPARSMCGPRPEALIICHGGRIAEVLPAPVVGVPLSVDDTCITAEGIAIGPKSAVVAWWQDGGMVQVARLEGARFGGVSLEAGLAALRLPVGDCMARMDELTNDECVGGLMCTASAQPGAWQPVAVLAFSAMVALRLRRHRDRTSREGTN